MEHDFLKNPLIPGGLCWSNHFDICTFGFEVSLETLRQTEKAYQNGAYLIVPLSREDFDREQDYKVVQYRGSGQFDIVENIMRTSFAQRIDSSKLTEDSLDVDYFNNSQRTSKLQMLEQKIEKLEADFRRMTVAAGREVKLAELVKDPKVKEVLDELR